MQWEKGGLAVGGALQEQANERQSNLGRGPVPVRVLQQWLYIQWERELPTGVNCREIF